MKLHFCEQAKDDVKETKRLWKTYRHPASTYFDVDLTRLRLLLPVVPYMGVEAKSLSATVSVASSCSGPATSSSTKSVRPTASFACCACGTRAEGRSKASSNVMFAAHVAREGFFSHLGRVDDTPRSGRLKAETAMSLLRMTAYIVSCELGATAL